MMKPRVPLKSAVASMIRGMVFEASRTSSDMCVAASGPMRASWGLTVEVRCQCADSKRTE